MNRQTLYRWLLVGLLLAMLVVPVLGAVAHQPATSQDHFTTLQVKDTAAPSAVLACTPPSSGNGCGGG
jgi:hypothetical protein